MKQRSWFSTTILAIWLAWLTGTLILDGYRLVSGDRRLDWSSVSIVVVFLIFALGVSFLLGRSIEREAMREKLRVIIRSGRLPVVEPHPLDNPTLIRINEPLTEAQEADLRAKWQAARYDAHRVTVVDTDTNRADFAASVAEVVKRHNAFRASLGYPSDEELTEAEAAHDAGTSIASTSGTLAVMGDDGTWHQAERTGGE